MLPSESISPLEFDAHTLRIAVVTSSYHAELTDRLRDGAVAAFHQAGGQPDRLQCLSVPGAFELTAVCRGLVIDRGSRTPDAVVALGCVITGETRHDEYIIAAVANGLTSLIVETGVPIAFGLLTCSTMDQAVARAGGDKGHKGEEAMRAAIRTAHVVRGLDAGGVPAR
jgi:6,7-dimethyl-8-ribityllumazine synthase